MFNRLRNTHGQFWRTNFTRQITSQEVNVALRPFYFAVHPDLFGQHPEQRATNEDSLKRLSAHIEALQQNRVLQSTPAQLPFYVRKKEERATFRLVKVPMEKSLDTKRVIIKILKSCGLTVESVENLKTDYGKIYRQQVAESPEKPKYKYDEFDSPFGEEFDLFVHRVQKTREEFSLKSYVHKNFTEAKKRSSQTQELAKEVDKLKETIKESLELEEVVYDCGWNVEHFRGCLKSLERLHSLHPVDLGNLKGRTVVFGSFTGVSLEGNVMLFTGDVQRNWLDLIKNVREHDVYLTKIPAYEYALSQVLRNINVARRKFMPKAQAGAYTSHLRKVTTSLLDYLGRQKFPKLWPEDLSEFEIVIESEAGPLMVSPTGQLIVPATHPGALLVDFITKNLDDARQRQIVYSTNKHVEQDLENRCMSQLGLLSLTKDDSVTSEKMIECLSRLVEQPGLDLKGIQLHITNYFSVLSDGTLCIPFDWKF